MAVYVVVLLTAHSICFPCALVGSLVGWFFGVLLEFFASLQHLPSYQDVYRVVTVRTRCNVIVLPHWEISQPAP